MSTDDQAAELVAKTRERKNEREEKQREFLDAVKDESETDAIETTVTLVDGYAVEVSVRLDGELTDTLAEIEQRAGGGGGEVTAADVQATADQTSTLLANAVDDDDYTAGLFREIYESEGLEPLGEMLRRVLEAVKEEREREEGVAEGFRPTE